MKNVDDSFIEELWFQELIFVYGLDNLRTITPELYKKYSNRYKKKEEMGTVIRIMKDGPAIITGIKESPVVSVHHEDGKVDQSPKGYAICRCGKSKNQPFCDGSHVKK